MLSCNKNLYSVSSCRVATHCEENKMPIPSLAKVFGPTIVGHSSPNPDPATIWKETNLQPKVL